MGTKFFFAKTLNIHDFADILHFICFDKRNESSQHLQIEEQLLSTKVRCRFTKYMSNKSDKFAIKFWLASDVETKYVIYDFPYLGKDEIRDSLTPYK